MSVTPAGIEHRNLTAIQRAMWSDAAYSIISTDPEGIITSFNPAAERALGWQAGEIVGKAIATQFLLPEEISARAQLLSGKLGRAIPPGVEVLLTEARSGARSDAEWTCICKDGSRLPMRWSVTPLHNEGGAIFGFLAMAIDITRRKLVEESLRESRQLYEELVASLPLGVYRTALRPDENSAFEYVSDRFCEITGLDRETILADSLALLNIIPAEGRKGFRSLRKTALRNRAPFDWEGRAIVRGEARWLSFKSRPTSVPGRMPFWTGVVSDVTNRRDVEEALHYQHSLLEGALQSTADGILAVSSDGEITSYNRQFLELWRIPREILDAHDTTALADYILQQLSNPAAMQSRIRSFSDTSKADTFDTLEFADGRVYERFSRPQLVDDAVVGRVWSFRDVTARHWAVASLRESEHKFKMLFESANDAILIMNETVFLDCNQVSEIMYGCPREQIVGASFLRFSPERQTDGRPSAEAAGEKIRDALDGAAQSFEWIHSRHNGAYFNAEVSLNRLELRGQAVIQAIVRDITARKQAEAAQHDAERLYRTLVNTSPDGICVLDMTGRMLFSSPKALELFYGSSDTPPPRESNALDLVSGKDRDRAAELLGRAINEKAPINERLTMRRSDEHEFVAELNGRLLRDGLGVPWGILIIFRDVTDRQRQEDELKSKNSELERFTYTVSHDLRSPLITIKGFAGALLSDISAGRTDRLATDLKRIVLAADKMSDLLNGLLELSRVGRIINPPMNISMDKLVQDVLELLAGSIAERQAKIAVQPGLPPAYGDPQRLQEVVQNLVENALKFSAPDLPPEIEIGCQAGDSKAYFVRDHGLGVEARHQESIFGLFNKLNPRTSGVGIGLALVRRIIEFHGGAVWVESGGAGQGATFYFTLPDRKALSSAAASEPT
jgi:PAS domain S-box-containing protein